MALGTAHVTTAVRHPNTRNARWTGRRSDDDQQLLATGAWSAEDLMREFKKLRSLLDRAEEVADGIGRMLAAAGMPVPERPAPAIRRNVRSRDLEDPRWEQLARRGVGEVRIGSMNEGVVPVAIDGAPAFRVTSAEASLLAVLLTGDARDDDGFPPFRNYRDLAAAYSVRTGRPESERAVIVGLGRVRRRLMTDGGVSPRLVETRPKRGARFRIRRTGP